MAPLIGTDAIKVPSSATLIFKHPALDPLYIHSGATAIQWAYHLNTQTTPTLGGEVVQVLSALVGPMTIKGQTAGLKTNETGRLDSKTEVSGWKNSGARKAYSPNHELQAIMEWFVRYMHQAGTHTPRRDERAIEFIYPERGWDFYIQVTKLDGFRYDKSVISPEWSISAEIVNDNALNYFAGITMSSFTDDLITNQALIGRIGLSAFAGSKTETDNKAFGQTGDHGSGNPFLNPELSVSASQAAKMMGDNFQGLVAAWSSGDFAHFGFSALLDNGALPKNVDAAYQQLFGTSVLGALPGNSGPGSTATGGTFTYNGNNPERNYAVEIANAFSSAGMPPELGVAVAIHESSLNPDNRNPNDGGPGIDGVGLFQAHNPGGADPSQACRMASSVDRANPPTKNYPASTQITNALIWFKAAKPFSGDVSNLSNDQLAQWAYAAQRGVGYTNGDSVTGSCTQQFAGQIAQAKSMIASFGQTSGGAASGPRLAVVQWANKLVQQYSKTGLPTYSEGCRRDVENMVPGVWPPSLDCSASIALLYSWGTNKDHRYGLNGTSFNNVTTQTIWNTWRASIISESAARAGDIIIYGYDGDLGSQHAEMFMENYNGDSTSVFSFGHNPPTINAFSSLKTGLPYRVIRVLP